MIGHRPNRKRKYDSEISLRIQRPFYSWGTKGNKPGELCYPTAIHMYGDIAVVLDSGNNRLQMFERKGSFLSAFGRKGNGLGELCDPQSLAIYNESIYITDYLNYRIQIFNMDGKNITTLSTKLKHPVGITVNENILAVSFPATREISIYSIAGEYIRTWNTTASPDGLAIDSHSIYSCHYSKNCIQRFSYDGQVISQFHALGPKSVHVEDGFIFISEIDPHTIRILKATDGELLQVIGKPGTGFGEFSYPMGLSICQRGHLFAADCYNHRIQVFS